MNATSLMLSTTRLVLQADEHGVGDPATLSDLYRLVPYLRQSLSCTVCGHLLREPFTPQAAHCQHHVCRECLGGRKNLKPTCQWCRDYQQYEINNQLRILLQCYRSLCEYIVSKPMYRHVIGGSSAAAIGSANTASASAGGAATSATTNGNGNGSSHTAASNSLLELIEEGARFTDNYKSNSGQLKSAYSMLPCVYSNTLGSPSATQQFAQPPTSNAHQRKRMIVTTAATQPPQQATTTAATASAAYGATGQNRAGIHVQSDGKLMSMNLQRSTAPGGQLVMNATPAGMRMHVQTHQVRPPLKQQQQQHQQQQHLRQQHIRIQHQQPQQLQQQQPQQLSNTGQFKTIVGTKWIATTSSPQPVGRQPISNPSTSTAAVQAASIPHQQQQIRSQSSTVTAQTYTVPTSAPIKTVSNGTAMYSVLYAGTGNKLTIKRKTDATSPQSQQQQLQHNYQQQQQQHANATAMRQSMQPIASTSAAFLNRPVTVSQYPPQQPQQQSIPVKLSASTTIRYQTQQPQQQQQLNFNQALLQQQHTMQNAQLQQQQNFKKPIRTMATVRSIHTSPIKPFPSIAPSAYAYSSNITSTTDSIQAAATASTTSPVAGTSSSSTTTTTIISAASAAAAAKRKGCRCGNATPTPGKLTCCGQRCPCYVEAKSCVDCKCRGCRNPHRPDGLKVRPHIPELDCIEMVPDGDGGSVGGVLRGIMQPAMTANMHAVSTGGTTGYLQLKSQPRFAVQAAATSSAIMANAGQWSSSGSGGSGKYMMTSSTSPAVGAGTVLSMDRDSIVFNPEDLDDRKNVQVVNLNMYSQSVPINKPTLNYSRTVPHSQPVASTSASIRLLDQAATTEPCAVYDVDDEHSDESGEQEACGVDQVDDNDVEDDDNDEESVDEASTDQRPTTEHAGEAMSFHMSIPDAEDPEDPQLLHFEHMLDGDSSPLADDDDEDFSPENSGRIVVEPPVDQADKRTAADDDEEEEEDDDDVEDDDENDEDFSMSDEPSDVDLD